MTYEIINAVTTNTVASFASEDEARVAFERILAADDEHAAELALVAFDDAGEALELLHAPAAIHELA